MGCNDKRKYQRNYALSFKRKGTAWNKRKDKIMTLDTQVNFAESDKGSFYNQKKWLEEYDIGRAYFIVNTVMTSKRLLLYFRTNLLMFW